MADQDAENQGLVGNPVPVLNQQQNLGQIPHNATPNQPPGMNQFQNFNQFLSKNQFPNPIQGQLLNPFQGPNLNPLIMQR